MKTNHKFAAAILSTLFAISHALGQTSPLQVNAGPDTTVPLSSPTANLNGSVTPNDPLLVQYQWQAPDGGTIQKPSSLQTSVSFTKTGSYRMVLSASEVLDLGGDTTVSDTCMVLVDSVPAVTSALTASGTVGTAFSYTITASGTTPITFNASPLPAGLAVNASTGLVSGTPTASGTTNVTLSATNAAGSAPTQTLVLTIAPAPVAPAITSALIASDTVGIAFSYTITASGTTPITFNASPLPAGLAVNASTGLISGTPTASGTTNVTLSATNAAGSAPTKTLAITIAPAPVAPAITSVLTASDTVGTAFFYTITASGTTPITFGASPLPPGLVVNASTGVISGTPTTAGTYNDSLYAHNVAGDATAKVLALTVAPAPVAPAITSALTASATVGTAFSYPITASGTTPITFGASPLPAGLSVNTSTGAISGTPTASGTTNVTLSATNAAGSAPTKTLAITIAPAPVAPAITSALTASATVGTAFFYTITASGTTPITFGASPLPPGLTVNTSTGMISGTPTTAGTYNDSLYAHNVAGDATAKVLALTVAPGPVAPAITSALTASATVGTAFSYPITASGTTPITFGASPLPPGLTVNASTGVISGTPTTAGTYNDTLSATNSAGSAPKKILVITVNAVPPTITNSNLSLSSTIGAAISYTITASGTTPIIFGASPLPTGLTLNTTTGVISGTPTQNASTTVLLSASNSAGAAPGKNLVITVSAAPSAPSITTAPLSLTVTAPGAATFTAAASGNPTPTFQWQRNNTNISGATSASYALTSTAASDNGTQFRVIATNSQGNVTSANATLTVLYTPVITTQPANETVGDGSTATFTAVASGNPAPGYQWKKNGTAISGATQSSYTTPALSLADSGAVFAVTASNSVGNPATSNNALLTVTRVAPSLTNSNLSISVTSGSAFSYSITASGSQPITFGASPLPAGLSLNTATGAISGAPTQSGTTNVTLSATNAKGSAPQKTLVVIVTAKPVPPIITTPPTSQTTTVGQPVLLTAIATGTAPFTYQWQKDTVNISGATSDTLVFASVKTSDAGRYRVVIKNSASVSTDSTTFAVSPFATLTVNLPQVAQPKASPRDTSFYPSLSVALTCDTVGAVIGYTTDGSTPTASSAVYSQPLILTATTTVKAIAFKSGLTNSNMLTAVYSLTPPNKTAPPIAAPSDTTFTTSVTITLSSPTVGAVLYYTTDGSAPRTTSAPYTAPFSLYQTTLVKAVAVAPGLLPSDTLSLTYHLLQLTSQVATPVATPPGERFDNSVAVQLSTITDSASIWYTTDSTNPVSSSTRKSYQIGSGLVLSQSTVIRAAATRNDWLASGISTQAYWKAPGPVISVPGQDTSFDSTLNVSLSVAGNFPIYYTLDGSVPVDSQLQKSAAAAQYAGLIHLTASATLVAVAMDGTLPSDTLTRFFTKNGSQLPPPGASPSGRLFSDTLLVTLKTSDPAVVIYYTTDGTIPTSAATRYTQPLRIDTTTTLQAIATKPGYFSSQVLIENYILSPDTPSISPPGGQYFSAVQVTLRDSSSKANIYYTLDGTTPVPGESNLYAGPFPLTQSTVVKAVAAAGNRISGARTSIYNLSPKTDTLLAPDSAFFPGSGYAFYNSGASGFSARIVLASPDTVFAPGIASIPFAILVSPAAPGMPFPTLLFTKPASETRSLFVIGPDGRTDFVSPGDSVNITASGIYFLGIDTVPPTVTFVTSSVDAADSTHATFVLNDNTATIVYSLQRSDDPRRNLSQIAALTPDTVRIALKNPNGVLASLSASFSVSDYSNVVHFPANGSPWYFAQRLTATQSPAVLHIGATVAYPWDLVSIPVQADVQPTFGQIATANHVSGFGVFGYQSASGQYVSFAGTDTASAGRGYWIGSTQSFSALWLPPLSLRAPAMPVLVHLDSGWNLIGDPLPQTLYWPIPRSSALYRVSSVKAPWAYASDIEDYAPSDSLQPWRGYFVYSYARDTTVELSTSPAAAAKPAVADDDSYSLVLDYGHRSLELGMFPNAKTGIGVEDESALPTMDSNTTFASLRQDHRLRADYLPYEPDSIGEWRVLVHSSVGNPQASFTLQSLSLPAGVQAWILSPSRRVKHLLDADLSKFQPEPGSDTLLILTGPPAALAKSGIFTEAQVALPGYALRLTPEGRGFSLDLELPSQTRVEARLLDVDGRTAGWLPSRWLAAGHHALSFNLDFQRRQAGPLSRGIYFLQLHLYGTGLPAQSVSRLQIID